MELYLYTDSQGFAQTGRFKELVDLLYAVILMVWSIWSRGSDQIDH